MSLAKLFKNKKTFLFLGIIAYIIILSFLSISKHQSYHSTLFDLGIFEQTLWNTSRDSLFATSLNSSGFSFLGFHASFFLILPSLIYKIFSYTETLLVLQTIFLAIGAIPVYLIALKRFKKESYALLLAFAYLLFPALGHINLFDVHEIAFAPFFVLMSFYFLEKENYKMFLPFLITSLLIKEEIAFIGIIFSVYLFFSKKNKKMALITFLLSSFWLFFSLYFIIPFFRHAPYPHIGDKYGVLGTSVIQVIVTILTKPLFALQYIFSIPKIKFIIQIFSPLLFTSFLGGIFFIISLPILIMYYLFASLPTVYSIGYQYSAFAIPIIFISSIIGMEKLGKIFKNRKINFIYYGIIIFSILASFLWGAFPWSKKLNRGYFIPRISKSVEVEIFSLIPSNASLSAENNLGPHFIKREKIYAFPEKINEAEYIILDRKNTILPFSEKEHLDGYSKILKEKKYLLIYNKEDIQIFKRI